MLKTMVYLIRYFLHQLKLFCRTPPAKSYFKKPIRFLGVIIFCLLIFISLTIIDLHYLGQTANWSQFEKARTKIYMLTLSYSGSIIPSIGPFKHASTFSHHLYHFTTKTLPDINAIEALRGMLTGEQFCKEIKKFSEGLKNKNIDRSHLYTKKIVQRVSFGGDFGNGPLFDDWAVILAGSRGEKSIQLSYFVWGLGITPDQRAEAFFGRQLGVLAYLIPMRWVNLVERNGIARGYWVLLTETDETSDFSYQARNQSSQTRIMLFLQKSRILHTERRGKTYNEICKKI
jgi:hypothetical protein